jgi:polysaccharide transporter, PST family
MQNSKNNIFHNIKWLGGDKILNMIISFIMISIVSRYLGPELFGKWNYIASIITLISIPSTLGLERMVKREILNNESDINSILGSCFILQLVSGLFFYTCIVLYATLFEKNSMNSIILIMLGTSILLGSLSFINYYFDSKLKSKYNVISKNMGGAIFHLLRVGMMLRGLNLIFFAFSKMITNVIVKIVIVHYYFKNKEKKLRLEFNSKIASKLLRDSFPLLLGSIAVIIYMKIDQIMIANMISEGAVGLYSASARLSELWYFIPGVISTSTLPLLVKSKKGSKTIYLKQIQAILNQYAVVAYAITIPILIFAWYFINLVYGIEYIAAVPMLRIHILSCIFVFIGMGASNVILIENYLVFGLITAIVGAVINIVLNLMLIPLYSGLGASISTLVSYSFARVFVNLLYGKTKHIGIMQLKALIYPISYIILSAKKILEKDN